MLFHNIISTLDNADLTSMSASSQADLIRQLASAENLTPSQLVNALRGKRDEMARIGLDKRSVGASMDVAMLGLVEVCLFKARRCYHAQFAS